MLLAGVNHIAMLTNDTERLCDFYGNVFGAVVEGRLQLDEGMQLTFVRLGPHTELNVFEIEGNVEADRQVPGFARGRIDHFGLHASSTDSFDEIRRRLIDCGATDGFVTDFGPILSVFFRDPDGLEAEVCVENPNAVPGVTNPPGTPAPGYDVVRPENLIAPQPATP